jgi:large repetitive protein
MLLMAGALLSTNLLAHYTLAANPSYTLAETGISIPTPPPPTASSGNWSDPLIWTPNGVPTSIDNVIIPNGVTVIINVDGAVCNNITIESGGTLEISGSNTLTVYGNWTNNGIFTANSSMVIFEGSGPATIGGASTTLFKRITLNKTTNNLIIAGTVNVDNDQTNHVLLLNGIMEVISGGTINFIGNAGFTIEEDAGIFVNGGTLTTGSFSVENKGLFRIDSGTSTLGASTGNSLTMRSTGKLDVNGGILNIAGRLEVSGGTVTMTGGTVNLNTVGQGSSSKASLDLSATSIFNMTAGTINFLNPNSTGYAI